jgi:hypothetical protein
VCQFVDKVCVSMLWVDSQQHANKV